jgi:hypothetical protein
VCWVHLSRNPNAIHILEKNLDNVYWYWLSQIPDAIHFLEQHLNDVDWYALYSNSNAVHLFTELNTNVMRENCKTFAEELAKSVFNPVRAKRMANLYELDMDQYFELL